MKCQRKIAKLFQVVTYWPFLVFAKVFIGYKVEGHDNLVGLENKSVVFASNHASYFDPPFCGYALPRVKGSFYPKRFFSVRFLAYKEFFSWRNRLPFPISLLAMFYVLINGSISVAPAKGDLEKALVEPVRCLKECPTTIWIYPEGKFTRDGKIGRGKRGVAYLHQQTGTVVVPVGIIGTYRFFSSGKFLRRPGIKVKFGKPINFADNMTLEEKSDLVMEKIKELI